MQNRPFHLLIIALGGFYAVACHAAVVRQYDFPELVDIAPLIVTGEVTITNTAPILAVKSVLKGSVARKELIIETKLLGDMPSVQFTNGENVILFLEQPKADGKASLLGYGDQAKWPRSPTSGGFPVVLGGASAEETVQMVRKLLAINKLKDKDGRLSSITEWLQSSDKATQLVALQYISHGFLWSPYDQQHTGRSSANLQERHDVLRRLLPNISKLVDSEEPSIRREAIRLFRFTPREMVEPLLEKAKLDKNDSVRAAAAEVQTTLSD